MYGLSWHKETSSPNRPRTDEIEQLKKSDKDPCLSFEDVYQSCLKNEQESNCDMFKELVTTCKKDSLYHKGQ